MDGSRESSLARSRSVRIIPAFPSDGKARRILYCGGIVRTGPVHTPLGRVADHVVEAPCVGGLTPDGTWLCLAGALVATPPAQGEGLLG